MEDIGELIGHQSPIPAEIILEILLKVTVKSLCRFRCVSKPWRALISNTKFIALHNKKALEDQHVYLGRRRVILTVPICNFYSLYSLDLDEFLTHADHHEGSVTATKLDFVYKELSARDFEDIVIHSCINLVLLSAGSGWYLVNPATREIRKVPKLPSWWLRKIHQEFGPGHSINGFGFDSSTNEYKVVSGKFVYSRDDDVDKDGISFSVYTLETDSWRHIDCVFHYNPKFSYGIFLNGAVHWLGTPTSTVRDGERLIVSFRLAEEEVREIQLPLLDISQFWSARLGVFRDCLCITFRDHQSQAYNEFWVMKEYGVSESWTRMKVSTSYHYLSHFGFSTKSHDLVARDESFVMYDFKEDSCWNIPIHDIPKIGDSVGTYVEGLFPLSIDSRTAG